MKQTLGKPPQITAGCQIRAARALLGWSRTRLAQAAGLNVNSVTYWEAMPIIRTQREPHACTRIRIALRAAGMEIIGTAKPGVRLVGNANFVRHPPSRARAHHGVKPILPRLAIPVRSKTQPSVAARREPSAPCGAKTRAGAPCRRTGLSNGRCANHGGASTGPKTAEGRARIAEVQRNRWVAWRRRRDTERLRGFT